MKPWQTALIEKKAGNWLVQNEYALSDASLTSMDYARIWIMDLAARMVKVIYYRNTTR